MGYQHCSIQCFPLKLLSQTDKLGHVARRRHQRPQGRRRPSNVLVYWPPQTCWPRHVTHLPSTVLLPMSHTSTRFYDVLPSMPPLNYKYSYSYLCKTIPPSPGQVLMK